MPRSKTFDKEVVLNKAMELFWEKGFHATSIQDLVTHLGINRASLYDTFGDKEKLFLSSIESYIEHNQNNIKQYLSQFENVVEGIRSLFHMGIDQALSDRNCIKGCFVVNMTTELLPGKGDMEALLQANMKSFVKVISQTIKSGQAQGQVNTSINPREFAKLLFSFNNGLHVVAKLNPSKSELKAQVDSIVNLLEN